MLKKINIGWWLCFLVTMPLMMYPMHQDKVGLKRVPRLDVDGWDKLRKEYAKGEKIGKAGKKCIKKGLVKNRT